MVNKVTPDMIGFGKYRPSGTEGPYFKGTIKFKLPENPGFLDKCLAILQSTEGRMDSINCYDSCIVSISMIQYCERFNLTSILLGKVATACGLETVTGPLTDAMNRSKCEFKCDNRGRWRFHFLDSRGEVDTIDKKKELFLGCSGFIGAWTPEAREHAKCWAAGLASIWESKEAQTVQINCIKNNLMSFVLKESKTILFTDAVNRRSVEWVGATRAIFISFAANNSTKANEQIMLFDKTTTYEKWSPEWCIGLIQRLTFGPNIAIYEHRYEMIRPHVEELFGIELPKSADELEEWRPPQIKEEEIVSQPLPSFDPLAIDEDVYPHPIESELEKIIPFKPPKPSLFGFLQWIFTMIMTFLRGNKK